MPKSQCHWHHDLYRGDENHTFVINISHCMETTVTFYIIDWKMIIANNEITQMAYLRSTMKYYRELSMVKKQSCPNEPNETPCISVFSHVPVRWHLPWQHSVCLSDRLGCIQLAVVWTMPQTVQGSIKTNQTTCATAHKSTKKPTKMLLYIFIY